MKVFAWNFHGHGFRETEQGNQFDALCQHLKGIGAVQTPDVAHIVNKRRTGSRRSRPPFSVY
jgi:hypothetical protein